MSHYTNPVARDGDFADPFVLRYNGRYYLYATNPDLRCWSSSDLVTWQPEGATIGPDVFPGLVPFAPEVVYSDGYFYLYTSPSGTGHHVLRSPSPTGPFELVTGNLGLDIDGNVLVDDDGRWYFYWAGEGQILAAEMTSPTQIGTPVGTGVTMHGWTEGPFVMKRDGWYHMTLTGNHYLSPGYRINAVAGTDPLLGLADDPLNPVVVATTGPAVGLGHSSTVLGPDLVSWQLVYHNLNPDHSRDLNVDRQVWNGRSLQVLGPSRLAVVPAPADAAGTPSRGAGWTVRDGSLSGSGDLVTLDDGAAAVWTSAPVGDVFTAELNLRLAAAPTTSGRYGLIVEHEDAELAVWLDAVLGTVEAVDANGTILASSLLPVGYRHDALHCVRITHTGGAVRVVVDGRHQLDVPATVPAGAVIGYATRAGALLVGHTALTNDVEARASRASTKPVPGRFWAALTDSEVTTVEVGAPVPWERLVLTGSTEASYRLLSSGQGEHQLSLTGVFPAGTAIAVEVAGARAVLTTTDDTGVLSTVVTLPVGDVLLRLTAPMGRADVDLVELKPVSTDPAPTRVSGAIAVAGKDVLVADGWTDYTVDATLEVDLEDPAGHGDVILRATQLAEGFEGNDPVLGIDFLLGYSVQLRADRVVLARHAYDEQVLACADVELDLTVPHRVVATVAGGRVTAQVDDLAPLTATDLFPHLVGGAGIRVLGGEVRADLTVTRP